MYHYYAAPEQNRTESESEPEEETEQNQTNPYWCKPNPSAPEA